MKRRFKKKNIYIYISDINDINDTNDSLFTFSLTSFCKRIKRNGKNASRQEVEAAPQDMFLSEQRLSYGDEDFVI